MTKKFARVDLLMAKKLSHAGSGQAPKVKLSAKETRELQKLRSDFPIQIKLKFKQGA